MDYVLPKVCKKTCYLQTVKLVKENLHIGLKEAKDMVDEGIIEGNEADLAALRAAFRDLNII